MLRLKGRFELTNCKLEDGFIKSTVESLGALLLDYYVFPETAQIMRTNLLEKLYDGEYEKDISGFTFTQKINDYLQNISNDKHLVLIYSETEIPLEPHNPINDEDVRLRQQLNNYGFERVERLPGNIGYLVINEFVYPEIAGKTAAHAMSFIADTDGLIIDLRKNSGGSSFMMAFIASFLLDGSQPIHLIDFYWRYYNTTQSFWSLPFVPGERFGANKPVYILTSSNTGSCAEEFAYNLQALQRVTVVGEKTAGKAHPGSIHRINEHFQVFIPNAYPINPITNSNWNGVGVIPDIECASDESYEIAYRMLLQQQLQHLNQNIEPGRKYLFDEIKRVSDSIDN